MEHKSRPQDEDILASYQCGCYIRRGVKGAPEWYFVRCSLHAAAPDLLAACKDAVSDIAAMDVSSLSQFDQDCYLNAIKVLSAAIAKAKGE